jgi:hypothetical protein
MMHNASATRTKYIIKGDSLLAATLAGALVMQKAPLPPLPSIKHPQTAVLQASSAPRLQTLSTTYSISPSINYILLLHANHSSTDVGAASAGAQYGAPLQVNNKLPYNPLT